MTGCAARCCSGASGFQDSETEALRAQGFGELVKGNRVSVMMKLARRLQVPEPRKLVNLCRAGSANMHSLLEICENRQSWMVGNDRCPSLHISSSVAVAITGSRLAGGC